MSHEDPHAIIARLWHDQRDVIENRLAAIDRGIEAIALGASHSHESVVEAHRAAHNLAGSLGSYGRSEGSAHARDLMAEITEPDADQTHLRSLLKKIEEACE